MQANTHEEFGGYCKTHIRLHTILEEFEDIGCWWIVLASLRELDTSGSSLVEIIEQRTIKKGSNIFIVDKFCRKCTCKIGDFKMVKHVYM